MTADRSPVHTVYGGAHLFSRATPANLGAIARRAFAAYAPDPATFAERIYLQAEHTHLAAPVHERVREKLDREPIEDFRIDFEDGFGLRSDAEEDEWAERSAGELAALLAGEEDGDGAPPMVGFRIKTVNDATRARAVRTLELFLTGLVRGLDGAGVEAGAVWPRFVVALPKLASASELADLSGELDRLERELGLPGGAVRVEIVAEHPHLLRCGAGGCELGRCVEASGGRLTAAHFGPYDYLTMLGVTAAAQWLHHPMCTDARAVIQRELALTGVRLVDGPTKLLPLEPHRAGKGASADSLTAEQVRANTEAVRAGWQAAYVDAAHSLANGWHAGWDLHPAQLPARFGAVFAFYLATAGEAAERMRSFLDAAGRAATTRTGASARFDDAASAAGVLAFFRQARASGALDEADLETAGLAPEDLAPGMTFDRIVARRGG